MKIYKAVYAPTMHGLITAMNFMTKMENSSHCVGWQQTRDLSGKIYYEAIMECETPEQTVQAPENLRATGALTTSTRSDQKISDIYSQADADHLHRPYRSAVRDNQKG